MAAILNNQPTMFHIAARRMRDRTDFQQEVHPRFHPNMAAT